MNEASAVPPGLLQEAQVTYHVNGVAIATTRKNEP